MRKLRVFYGFAKLNKIQKKPELQVIFENGNNNPFKNVKMVERWMHIVYIRNQTKEEMRGVENEIRMFTKYSNFIDDKPWNGDIEKVLTNNFYADSNHVSEEERDLIRQKLRDKYYSFYKRKPLKVRQLEMF